MIITISPAGRGRFRASLGTCHLCTSDTPFLSAARALLRDGVDPATPLAMTREGNDTVDIRSTVGAAARLTVLENEQTGPIFRPHRALPAHLRAESREVAACA